MNHILVIFHFLAFSSGIGFVTIASFLYAKTKSQMVRNILFADISYTFLLFIDTLAIYIRKNVTSNHGNFSVYINWAQSIAISITFYFLFRIIYMIIKKSITFNDFSKRVLKCYIILFSVILATSVILYIGESEFQIYNKIPFTPIVYFIVNIVGLLFIREFNIVENGLHPVLGLSDTSVNTSSNTLNTALNNASSDTLSDTPNPTTPNEQIDVFEQFSKQYNITERELEIVRYVVEGLNNQDIGTKLFISSNTVRNHIYNIYRKVGVKNRYELISIFNKALVQPFHSI